MRKSLFLLVCLAVAAIVCAQERDFSKVEIKVTKVAGNVYMLQGAGGVMAAQVGDDGILLVDNEFAPLTDKIRAALKSIADKPVRFVINTHWHFDHTGGNTAFNAISTVIAQENVRKRMEKGGVAGNGGAMHFESKPEAAAALPVVTFDQNLTIHLNGEDIELVHYPAAHTDGDTIVYFPKSNVVHTGDIFVTYGFPFIDIDSGGSVKGMISAVEQVLARVPPDVKVIPGHGDVCSVSDLRAYVAMLKDTTAVVEKALESHKTLEQMKAEKILQPWNKYSGEFVSTDAFLETLYNSLSKKQG